MMTEKADRECAVCGQFYPSDPGELRRDIGELIARATLPKIEGTIRGVIGPHAGYIYSGFTAAHAYGLLKGGEYSTVVVVSPSHQEYFDGISVYSGNSYSTPLGIVRVDKELRTRLLDRANGAVTASPAGHRGEHAIEVHLPFLQHVLGEFPFLPLVMGDQRKQYCFALGEILGDVLKGENVLLVASTDLSHYHPADVARQLDAITIEDVKNFDYEALMRDLDLERTEACGGGPAVAVMMALRRLGVRKMSILHQCNSGDITGDHAQVVGYFAAAAYA